MFALLFIVISPPPNHPSHFPYTVGQDAVLGIIGRVCLTSSSTGVFPFFSFPFFLPSIWPYCYYCRTVSMGTFEGLHTLYNIYRRNWLLSRFRYHTFFLKSYITIGVCFYLLGGTTPETNEIVTHICSCHNFFPLSSVQILFIPACCLLCVL